METNSLQEYFGIDHKKKDGNMLVGYNPNHQNNVDTNDVTSPVPFETTILGFKSYSLFKRLGSGGRNNDGNPLIYALKGKEGYGFINPDYDIKELKQQAIRILKAMTKR